MLAISLSTNQLFTFENLEDVVYMSKDTNLSPDDSTSSLGRLLSIKAVADDLEISTRGVWRLIANEQLPRPVKIGKSSRLFQSDLDNYKAQLLQARAR